MIEPDHAPDVPGCHYVRVRYAETDQMGVAHHGSYVDWIEEARTEWMRRAGRSYRSMEEEGLFMAVVRLAVRYVSSVRYDDRVRIETKLTKLGKASIDLSYTLYCEDGGGERLVAEAETRLALLGPEKRPLPVPHDLFPEGAV